MRRVEHCEESGALCGEWSIVRKSGLCGEWSIVWRVEHCVESGGLCEEEVLCGKLGCVKRSIVWIESYV